MPLFEFVLLLGNVLLLCCHRTDQLFICRVLYSKCRETSWLHVLSTFVIIILQGNPTNACTMHMLVTFSKKIIVSVFENSTSR